MSNKARWLVLYFSLAVVPLFAYLIYHKSGKILGHDAVINYLFLAPIIGLTLISILGWQINQTRIFWSALILLGLFLYFLHFHFSPHNETLRKVTFEIISASLPISFCILFLLRESQLFSDRSLARVILASLPFGLFSVLSAWQGELYNKLFFWNPIHPVGVIKIPYFSWIASLVFLLVIYLLPDMRIKPFLISLAVTLIPLQLAAQIALGADLKQWDALGRTGQYDYHIIVSFTAVTLILLHSVLHMYWKKVYIDILTGVPNRQALDERLHTLRVGYALAMVDIDHFKKFNDNYGHAEGDNVLRMVAQRLEGVLGTRVYRYGGEEFCAVFEKEGLEGAAKMMEKARVIVAKRKFVLRKSQRRKNDFGTLFSTKSESGGRGGVPITVSIGVAACGNDPTEYAKIIKKADQALYEAKEKGRNRVVS